MTVLRAASARLAPDPSVNGPGWETVTHYVMPEDGMVYAAVAGVALGRAEVSLHVSSLSGLRSGLTSWTGAASGVQVSLTSEIPAGSRVEVQCRALGDESRCWVNSVGITVSDAQIAAGAGGAELQFLSQPADASGDIGDTVTLSAEWAPESSAWSLTSVVAGTLTTVAYSETPATSASVDVTVTDTTTTYFFTVEAAGVPAASSRQAVVEAVPTTPAGFTLDEITGPALPVPTAGSPTIVELSVLSGNVAYPATIQTSSGGEIRTSATAADASELRAVFTDSTGGMPAPGGSALYVITVIDAASANDSVFVTFVATGTDPDPGTGSSLRHASIIPNGGTIPGPIEAGDTVVLMAVSKHNPDGSKDMTPPAGWPSGSLAAGATYIPDLMRVVKQSATGNEDGTSISFGANCSEIQVVVFDGPAVVESGPAGSDNYSGSISAPSMAFDTTGTHIVHLVQSGPNASISPTPSGYSLADETVTGASYTYGRSAVFVAEGVGPGTSGTLGFSSPGGSCSTNVWSTFVTGEAPDPAVPPTPTGFAVSAGNGQATVTWGRVTAYPEVTSYEVSRELAAGGSTFTTILSADDSSHVETGLANGTAYKFWVTAVNAEGSSTPTAELTVTPSGGGDPASGPDAPDLSIVGATTVTTGQNLRTLVAAGSPGDRYYFPAGTYTNVENVQPKDGMAFISDAGAVIDGGGTKKRAFIGANDNILFAGLTFQNFDGGSQPAQNVAVIDPKSGEWDEGSQVNGHDWRIHNCSFLGGKNVAVIMAHRFIVDECTFRGHNPQAIGGGFGTGGWIYGNDFKDCGYVGAGGDGANRAQVKLAFWNVGPWGESDRDTSRFRDYFGNPFGSNLHTL